MSQSYPFKAIATLKYKPPPPSTFSFSKDDAITVLEAADDDGDWYKGVNEAGVEGVFPANFVAPAPQQDDGQDVDEPAPAEPSPPATTAQTEEVPPPAVDAPPSAASPPPPPIASPSPPPAEPSKPLPQPPAPAPAPALASASAAPSSAPDAPAKPQSLKDRIAALNAAGAGAAPPPPTRPKPSFARKPWSPPAPAAAPIPSPGSGVGATSSPSPIVKDSHLPSPPIFVNDGERVVGGASREGAMSAEDAKASIGAGGSLRDRIKALQAGSLDRDPVVPSVPTPGPKPWKRKEIVTSPESEEGAPVGEDEVAVVTGDAGTPPIDTAALTEEERAIVEDADGDESAPPPAPEQTAEQKKAALIARMASLGGQKFGMPMPAKKPSLPSPAAAAEEPVVEEKEKEKEETGPIVIQALPKRAGPPRRARPAIPKAADVPVEVVQDTGIAADAVEKAEQSEEVSSPAEEAGPSPAVEDAEEKTVLEPEEEGHVVASLTVEDPGVAEEGDPVPEETFEEEPATEAPELEAEEGEESEKEETTLPHSTPPLKGPPPPPVRPVVAIPTDVEDVVPTPPEGEEELVDEYYGEEEPVPVNKEPEDYQPADEDEDASPAPTSPATSSRPAIPAIPTSFAATGIQPTEKEAIVIPRSEPEDDQERVDDDVPVPTSPATSSRPAIPAIPASFAQTTIQPTEKANIVIPRAEEEVEEEPRSPISPSSPVIPSRPPPVPASFADIEKEEEVAVPRDESTALAGEPEESREAEEPAAAEPEAADEEEEEEDPEIARRRAIAARMAKLGGMNMRMGPMFPPVGGIKKPSTKKSVSDEPAAPPAEEEEEAPAPPPRRPGGIPTGGFLLPGMVAKVPEPEPEPEPEVEHEPEADVEAEAEPEEVAVEEEAVDEEEYENVEPQPVELGDPEEEYSTAPPPLPAGRPSQPPPRRELPTPDPSEVNPPTKLPQVPSESTIYDEPEEVPEVPSSPPTRAVPLPSSPQQQPAKRNSRGSFSSLKRKIGSGDSGMLGVSIPRGSIDLNRQSIDEDREAVSSPSLPEAPAMIKSTSSGGGGYKARDLDLSTASQWWRAQPFAPPMSVVQRKDAVYDVSESTATKRGKTRHDNEIEIIYNDLSKTILSISFTDDDASEASTSINQAHFPPPPFPSATQLSSYSSTIGAQIFAAAHSKLTDKSARLSTEAFVDFCFSRATDPLPPIGYSYGVPTLTASVDGSKKASSNETDEPRAGDIIVFWDTKFKQTLSTTKVGTADKPHVAVVAAWDAKKRKIRVIEISKDMAVDEGAYKLEDLKGGSVIVYRVVERAFVDAQ
ncbi:SH3 domain protein [Pseudohyphozyma bogoriensis]|nr:SH3 domain protein [Pseudohyphozyma bogoriensis]